ncbi:MAG: DUF4263 domain-containing protein, partial [Candidatus Nitrosotenuis sp.]
LAASLAEGVTVIKNAAMEPEVVTCARYLKAMGAKISGEGTSTVKIEGVKKLSPANWTVIPDRMEAGTYLLAGAITNGKVTVIGVTSEWLRPFLQKLVEANSEVDFDDEGPILIIDVEKFKKISQIMKNDPASAILYAFENDEIENIFIRLWSESPEKFKEFQQEHIVAEKNFFTLLAQLKPDTIEELNGIIRDSTSILNKKIAENYQKFNERLEEFRRLFEKKGLTTEENSYLENKIKEHLHKNPWIIDLTYDSDSVDTRQHDYVDVFLVNSYFGIKKGVIIELKRPDAKTEKTYRGREAIRSAVTDAIGQLIHYTEDVLEDEIKNAKEDDPSLFVEGMIIIGNNMKEFHQVFNKYLHNVRIKSYREIYDDATKRLRTLTQGPSEESKENILEQ